MSTQKARSPITTHVLDVSTGKPGAQIDVELEFKKGEEWKSLANGKTNQDGRIEDLLIVGSEAEAGVYRLRFHTNTYFKGETFYPYTEIVFEIKNSKQHYHVPLLISPYGYSTYRGT